jgi:hypothetical protein
MLPRLATASITLALICCLTAACGEDRAREPSVPEVDFTPVLVVTVDDDTIRVDSGPRQLAGVSLEPLQAPAGSVVEFRNDGDEEQRVVGNDGIVIDTGVLLPGEATTVVLADADEIALREFNRPDDVILLTLVEPSPDSN